MDWFLKFFPDGWVIEPRMKIYSLVKVVVNRLEELEGWIKSKKNIIPYIDDPELERWEKMIEIQNKESGEQRVVNIRNKLIGEWGRFNEKIVKDIIEFYTNSKADFSVSHVAPLRSGKARAGNRVVSGESVFDVFLEIKNQIENNKKKMLNKHLNTIKHTHINLHIRYTAELT